MLRKFVIPVSRFGAPVNVDGIVETTVSETFNIRASVQPLNNGQATQYLVDLRDAREVYRVYTDAELLPADEQQQADKMTVFGREFEVRSCENWQNGIKPHYKAIIAR